MSLITQLSDILGAAFIAEGLNQSFGRVTVSDRPDLAQFQCNGALAAAKSVKKNPRMVADAIVAQLKDSQIFAKIEIAGPGFINLTLNDAYLAQHINKIAVDERIGVHKIGNAQTVMVDYGGPNVAKAMHVGHLRSSIIGDSVRRIMQFMGYKTIGDIHMGDWGTMMGMVISELELMHPEWVYFDANYTGEYPKESPVTMEDLAVIYPKASGDSKASVERMALSHKATVELQNKRAGYYALWQHMLNVSIISMKANFDALNVHFDLWKGESSVHDLIAPMVERLQKNHYAVMSDGAMVVHVKRNDDDKEYPPLMLYKRDGAVLYGTTDLATLVERMNEYNPNKIIYVVDGRQSLHFEQLFRAAKLTGIVSDDVELTHAGFGTMNGTDGKPFKTRDGGVVRLEDLIEMACSKGMERLNSANVAEKFSIDEKNDIAMKVGIAAIKFADLQNNRVADYVFDLDRMTSFEGKTGPYLLYQAVRIKSLLEKAGYKAGAGDINPTDNDRALILMLTELPEVIEGAARNYTPHIICDHAYKLAQSFSSFYGNTHIMSEENAAQKQSWLKLSGLVLNQLELMLDLIGVKIPNRM